MILLIDNYDSFVFNLARYFQRLGQQTEVIRNDAIYPQAALAMRPNAIVLSPGPCSPAEAGQSLAIIRELHRRVPILGICLGHQAIAAAFGGRIVRATEPVHGRASEIFHSSSGVFAGLPNPITACRYHSLVVDRQKLPDCLEVSAETADGTIMALAHRQMPVVGLQFHPESVLTEHGYALLAAFLRSAGIEVSQPVPTISSELAQVLPAVRSLPEQPVTF